MRLQTCHSRRRTSPQDQKNFRHCSCHHCSIFRTYHLLSDLLKSNGINSCYYTFIPSVLPLPTHSTLLSFPIKLWDVFFFPLSHESSLYCLVTPWLGARTPLWSTYQRLYLKPNQNNANKTQKSLTLPTQQPSNANDSIASGDIAYPPPPSLDFHGWSVHRSGTLLSSHAEFTRASALLCLRNTVSWRSFTTLTLTVFLLPLLQRFWSLGVRSEYPVWDFLCIILCSLHAGQMKVSVLIGIYTPRSSFSDLGQEMIWPVGIANHYKSFWLY